MARGHTPCRTLIGAPMKSITVPVAGPTAGAASTSVQPLSCSQNRMEDRVAPRMHRQHHAVLHDPPRQTRVTR